MRIMIGEKIKTLRKKDGRTQDDLAKALGITNQAVSRWEANKAYPDMEMIPAIANYFHVSIDELFGYNNDRESTLSSYIEKADAFFKLKNYPPSDKKAFQKQEVFLREALTEFPNEWHLQERLAQLIRMISNINKNEKKGEDRSKEATELLEQAYQNCDDIEQKDYLLHSFIEALNQLGDYQKIKEIALHNTPVFNSREIIRATIMEENLRSRYISEAFLVLLHQLAETVNDCFNYFSATNEPGIYLSIAELYQSAFKDGDYEWFHSDICMLFLNASRICDRMKDSAHAIKYFDKAYDHCISFMEASKHNMENINSPLFSDAVDFPCFFVYVSVSDNSFKQYLRLFSEEVISKIRDNPKYTAIF